jgi:pimeloyl-ACP methyl ester carboxylesterase
MPQRLPRLVLFPGLGIDERLFDQQKPLPVRLEFPMLPTPHRSESVGTYAARVAQMIDPTPPLYLGGVSFGAMIALEMAQALRASGVFFISGCTRPREISPVIRIGAFLATGMPRWLYPTAALVAPAFLRLLGKFDRQERAHMAQVFRAANFELARWGAREIMRWRAPANPPCPVHWIHGSSDHIVPPERVNADVLVPGAGHFINVTHPREVNDFITARLQSTPAIRHPERSEGSALI